MELSVHAEMRGDHVCLVYSTGAGAADVDFLQGNHVGPAFRDHGGDARGIELAVGAEAAVDVIGEETYPLSHRFREHAAPAFRSGECARECRCPGKY